MMTILGQSIDWDIKTADSDEYWGWGDNIARSKNGLI